MARIHEELYNNKGENFQNLNLSAYIRKLVEKLFQTYRLEYKNLHLQTDLEENIFLNMDDAVPFGIIVTELVSNSLKHAFLGRDEGIIYVGLYKNEDGELRTSREERKYESLKSTSFILKVSDDGVGIPKSIDFENPKSLGMHLVTTLVDQLDGELKLKQDNKTEFTIRFIVTEK
jgi:two-component sensor histidine kinase